MRPVPRAPTLWSGSIQVNISFSTNENKKIFQENNYIFKVNIIEIKIYDINLLNV